MQAPIFRTTLFFACLLCLLGSQPVFAKKMYRWVDEHGETYFSDQVPPEQTKHSRASLSKSGRVLEVTEKAKTKEQLEQEKRLEELRKQQEKLIANQKIHDQALLSTFRSKEDMLLSIQAKEETLDKQKNLIEGNLNRFTEQLKKQQKEADPQLKQTLFIRTFPYIIGLIQGNQPGADAIQRCLHPVFQTQF